MFSLLSARVIARPLLAQRALAPLGGAFGAVATMRSMRTTAVLLKPTKRATTTKKAASTEKTSTKKATKTATAAKEETKTTAQKKPTTKPTTKPKEPKTVEKKPAKPAPVKLTADDKPPRRPANPYALFIKRDVSRPEVKPKNLQEAQAAVKQASLTWSAMTDAEKQPFKDEAAALRAAWQVKYDAWSEKIDITKLRLLNKKRADKGKRKIVRSKKADSLTRIMTPYTRFVQERSKQNNFSETGPTDFVRMCAVAWKNLSKAEQKPFLDAYALEKGEYLKAH